MLWFLQFRKRKYRLPLLSMFVILISFSVARAAEQIRVGYGSLSTSYAAIWLAGEARLFEKNGINAEVLYLESALVRAALISGEIAMGGMSGTTMAAPRLQGADPIIIASFANALQYRLVVRPDIRTVADLKGKRVGVASFGLGAHRGAQVMLAKLGLNPDTDVTMLQIGGDPTRLSALLSGSIDASVFNPPLHHRAVEAGMKILANIEEMNFPVQGSALVTTDRFIKKNPDVVRRAIRSIIESIHLIKTNPELTKRAIRKYMRFKDDRDTEEAYQIMRDIAPRKPYPTVEGMKAVLDELSLKLPAAKTAQPRDFMDTRFIEELDRSGFIDRLYK
ncbi:MAG TPA: ABC transporter substrate-binding protein [Candidatus Binatia bacterium]|nr:ABC transporter substrate-binding protein [Candidatus Binatia bacterium]